jgi:hypothetical protein
MNGYYSDGASRLYVGDGGMIGSIGTNNCWNTFSLGFDVTLPEWSCSTSERNTYYSRSSSLTTDVYLYQDPYLTVPAINGYYSDGSLYWRVEYGVVQTPAQSCPTPPPPSVGPFSFSLTISSGPSVNINWSYAENATSYSVFRSEDNISFSQIYNTSSEPSYIDSSVLGGGVGTPNYYYYYMTANNETSNYTTSSQLIGVE